MKEEVIFHACDASMNIATVGSVRRRVRSPPMYCDKSSLNSAIKGAASCRINFSRQAIVSELVPVTGALGAAASQEEEQGHVRARCGHSGSAGVGWLCTGSHPVLRSAGSGPVPDWLGRPLPGHWSEDQPIPSPPPPSCVGRCRGGGGGGSLAVPLSPLWTSWEQRGSSRRPSVPWSRCTVVPPYRTRQPRRPAAPQSSG